MNAAALMNAVYLNFEARVSQFHNDEIDDYHDND